MASTNKTPKLGLNQWAAGDSVLRTDFNGDNLKIEAGMEALSQRCPFVAGFFVGDGANDREISVGFKPSLVIIMGLQSSSHQIYYVLPDGNYISSGTSGEKTAPGRHIALSSQGFIISLAQVFNGKGQNSLYIAFR